MMYNKIFANELPAAIMAFVTNSFPKQSIAFAEEKKSKTSIAFLISLNDGTELGFTPSGACVSVYNPYENYSPILI